MMKQVGTKIAQVELHTKRLMRANLFGHARSKVKGGSLEFDQLRDYQMGDDVRALDWNSSARMNKLLVKQFHDERHRTIIVALDVSESLFYGSEHLKYDVLAQISAIIGYAAFLGKDEVGLLLFSDHVETYIPTRKGRAHVQIILEKIFATQPVATQQRSAQTRVSVALDYIAQLRKKNAMVFLVSDFIDDTFEKSLSALAPVCDIIAVRLLDAFEHNFPVAGLISVRDIETGSEHIIDTRKSGVRFGNMLQERINEQAKIFARNRVDLLDIKNNAQLVDQLIHFFRLRKR